MIRESEILSRRCDLLESRLKDMDTALSSLTPDDLSRLEQHHEQLLHFKGEISGINSKLLYLSSEESGKLSSKIASLEKRLFECSLRHKDSSYLSATPALLTHSDPNGVKLPQLAVPVFNGNILNWTSFWEQFVYPYMIARVHLMRRNMSTSNKH